VVVSVMSMSMRPFLSFPVSLLPCVLSRPVV
jgi:hypothetical protein